MLSNFSNHQPEYSTNDSQNMLIDFSKYQSKYSTNDSQIIKKYTQHINKNQFSLSTQNKVERVLQEVKFQLTALGLDINETQNFRCINSTKDKSPKSLAKKLVNQSIISQLINLNEQGNDVYFVVNGNGQSTKKLEIKMCYSIFVECDKDEQESLIPLETQYNTVVSKMKGLQPTLCVYTGGKSLHFYYTFDKPVAKNEWESLQKDFIELIPHSDKAVKDCSRIMRLISFRYCKNNSQKFAGIYLPEENKSYSYHELLENDVPVENYVSRRYSFEELREVIPISETSKLPKNIKAIQNSINSEIFNDRKGLEKCKLPNQELAAENLCRITFPIWLNPDEAGEDYDGQSNAAIKVVYQLAGRYQSGFISEDNALKLLRDVYLRFSNLDEHNHWTEEDIKYNWQVANADKREHNFTIAQTQQLKDTFKAKSTENAQLMERFVNSSELLQALRHQTALINGVSIVSTYLKELKEKALEPYISTDSYSYYSKQKYILLYKKCQILYFYNTVKGCYEVTDFSQISASLGDIVKRKLFNLYFSAAKSYKVKTGDGQVIYPFDDLKTLCNEEIEVLRQKVVWVYKDYTKLHKDSEYAFETHSDVVITEPLKNIHDYLINLRNGVFNILTKELLPHSPEYQFGYMIDANFLGMNDVKPLKILDFLSQALKQPSIHIKTIRAATLAGITGKAVTAQCFLEFSGKPGSGKSTTQNLITFAVGAVNTETSDLKELSQRFKVASFIDKLHLCIGDAEKYLNDRLFLRITGGDFLSVERKGKDHEQSRKFKGITTVSSNHPITLSDSSLAIERRRILITFNPRKGIEKELLTKGDDDTWTGDLAGELNEFITWILQMDIDEAISHLKQVKTQKDEDKTLALIDNNPVLEFMNDSLILDRDSFIPMLNSIPNNNVYGNTLLGINNCFYSSFTKWQQNNNPGAKSMSRREVTANLKSLISQPGLLHLNLEYDKNFKRDTFYNHYGLKGARIRGYSNKDELVDFEKYPRLLDSELNSD